MNGVCSVHCILMTFCPLTSVNRMHSMNGESQIALRQLLQCIHGNSSTRNYVFHPIWDDLMVSRMEINPNNYQVAISNFVFSYSRLECLSGIACFDPLIASNSKRKRSMSRIALSWISFLVFIDVVIGRYIGYSCLSYVICEWDICWDARHSLANTRIHLFRRVVAFWNSALKWERERAHASERMCIFKYFWR